jgi:hypothetical protein
MNEIVIKDDEGMDSYDIKVKAKDGYVSIVQSYDITTLSNSEALQLADAIYKLLNEPTREQCFEAGKIIQGCGMNTTLTDYINEFKKEKDV